MLMTDNLKKQNFHFSLHKSNYSNELEVIEYKNMIMRYKLFDNEDKKQYELRIDTQVAKIEYIKAAGTIYLTHTEVPKALEGKGIAKEMVLRTLEDIEKNELTLVPLCPFVAAYIKKHPEWRKLVLKGVNIK